MTTTLAERIAEACSPEAWERSRIGWGDDASWNEPAKIAKRARVQAACERAIVACGGNTKARTMLDLRASGLSAEERELVEIRLRAAQR